MRRFLFIVFVSISGLVCGQSQSQTIYFQSGNVSLTPEGTLDEQVDRLPTENGISYGLVCFSQLPSEAEKKALASRGISLLDYMPKNTFFARIEGFVSGTFYPSIVGIFPVPVVGKLSEELSKKRYPAHALTSEGLTVNGLLFHGYSEDLFRLKVGELGGTWISSKPKYQVATFIIPLDRIDVLTEVIGLQYLEVIPEPGEPENDRARANHRVGSLTKNYTGLSKDLNGTGMSVMLQDDGIIGPHIDFEGRITQFLNYDGANQHGDHTGGTVSGAGNLDPRYAGMAPGSHLYVYGAAPTYPGFDSIASHYSKYDIKITSTSYSNGCNDGYTTLARELDIQVEQMDALSHVFSAGNNGRSDCSYGAGAGWGNITGGHKVAKNVITVANLDFEDNLNGSSSRGPAEDGRIKPDISAVGTDVMSTTNDNDYVRKTGTSMSCPGVAGTLTLLYQAYKEKNAGAYPDQELMKGVICNSADDLGRPGVDFEYGFGRINARKAFDIISNRQYFSGSLSNGDSGIHQLSFPSNVLEVKVMLIWKDPKGAVNANTPLVNDLDLVLLDPNSMENLPLVLDHRPTVVQITANAQPGRDSINNLEQVVIQGPMPGNYTIKVKGSHIPVGSQEYYVVYSYTTNEIIVEYPVGGEKFAPNETETIRWSSFGQIQNFIIDYSTDSAKTWNTVGSALSNLRHFNWTVPNIVSGNVQVRVRGTSTSGISPEPFSIMGVSSSMLIQKACPKSIEIQWNNVTGATSYTVYKLGNQYMDSIGTSTGPSFVASGPWYNPYQQFWFSVSANGANHAKGRRTKAVQSAGRILGCQITKDMELNSFVSEVNYVSSCNNGGRMKIGVLLINRGSMDIINPEIYYSLNASGTIKETYSGTVKVGDSLRYVFTNGPTLSQSNNQLMVWLSDAADENPFNDTLKVNSQLVSSTALASCSTTNFDNLNLCSIDNDCSETECPLQDGWINFKNGLEDDIDWRAYNQKANTPNTGPSLEHTNGSPLGRFIYLEASGSCERHEAILLSPCIDLVSANTPKLDFWYHMYGSDMGSLRVDVLKDGLWVLNIFEVSGNKGNRWNNAVVDLHEYKGSIVQLRFVGITGNGFYSDLALDDISISDPPKADFEHALVSGQTISFADKSINSKSWYWDFGDGGNTSTQQNPINTYSAPGNYVVKLIVENDCSKDSLKTEVEVRPSEVNLLKGNFENIKVYPLPANQALHISSIGELKIQKIQITDMQGRIVLNELVEAAGNAVVDVSSLKPGMYHLRLNDDKVAGSGLIEIVR